MAIALENEAKERWRNLQVLLEDFADILRFQNPESPHLTLQFWPQVMEIEYDQIIKKVEKIAAQSHPFDLKIQGISTFGAHGEDKVIFLDVPFSEELARLKKRCPWPNPPGKPFNPHITLARIRHPQKFAVRKKKILKILGVPEFKMRVERLRLYAEIDGKKQTPIRDFQFSAP